MMRCVWCDKKGKKIFHARVHWKNLDSKWYKCTSCGSLMMMPRPSKKAMQEYYESGYTNKLQPHGIDYRIRYSKVYRPTVFDGYSRSLMDVGIDKKRVKSVLDFGCADGVFLEFCKKYFNAGTTLWGTDISEEMLEITRKNGWNVIFLKDLSSVKKKFDLITLWDVIEHIEEPNKIMSVLKRMLTPKGRIVIQTPRVGLLADALGEQWEHLLPVQHINLASKAGMQKFVRRMRLVIDGHKSFGANAPLTAVANPHKKVFDELAKKLDFGSEQVLSLKVKTKES